MKLGRLPRTFDPSVKHVSVLRAAAGLLPPLPVKLDNAAKLPPFVGMMKNDVLGDCTCAGMGHLIQIWTGNVGAMLTEPDDLVVQAYEEAAGYRPGDSSTDRGANEQDVIRWWQQTGFPMADGTRFRVGAAFEANPKNLAGLCEVIMEFGAAYIGFEVPDGFMEDLPALWVDKPEYGSIVGGHCVLLHGFDRTDLDNIVYNVTSWGTNRQYRMRSDFLTRYVDEAYGIVSPLWVDTTGKTPYNLDLSTLAALGGLLGTAVDALAAAARDDQGALEAAKYGVPRSPHWATVEREFKAAHPGCAAGGRGPIQVHHKLVSFHIAILLGRPDLELDPRNLIGLTEGPDEEDDGLYHLYLGHGDNFQKDCNPHVEEDVVTFRGIPCSRIKADVGWQAHAAACPPPWSQWSPEMKAEKFAWLNEHLPPDPAVLNRFGIKLPG